MTSPVGFGDQDEENLRCVPGSGILLGVLWDRAVTSLPNRPQEVAKWLRLKYGTDDAAAKKLPQRVRHTRSENQHVA